MSHSDNTTSDLSLETNRLLIRPIQETDAAFMLILMNTRGWLDYIGDRHITSLLLAKKYIAGLLREGKSHYFVVLEKDSGKEVGVLSLVQRDYLEYVDLGFAFLPQFHGKGMAFEAASSLMARVKDINQTILAVTTPDNTASQALIEKLNFSFLKTIFRHDQPLLLYIHTTN